MEKVPLLKCPRCETENEVKTAFCQGCGAKIRWVYQERTCSYCGNVWRPRTANPKLCPGCGYRLSRDNIVEIEIPIQIIDVGDGMVDAVCVACGKRTRRFVEFRFERKGPVKNVCYVDMEDYFHKKNAEDVEDMVEGSFVTVGIEKLEDGTERLIKE